MHRLTERTASLTYTFASNSEKRLKPTLWVTTFCAQCETKHWQTLCLHKPGAKSYKTWRFSSFWKSNFYTCMRLFLTSASCRFKIKAPDCLKTTEWTNMTNRIFCSFTWCFLCFACTVMVQLTHAPWAYIIIDLINVDFYGQFRFMMLVVQVGNRGQRLEHVTYSPVIDQSYYHTSRIDGPFWSRWGKT